MVSQSSSLTFCFIHERLIHFLLCEREFFQSEPHTELQREREIERKKEREMDGCVEITVLLMLSLIRPDTAHNSPSLTDV